jgi:hypothetical protein
VDSHHLATARKRLRGTVLTPLDEVLNGRTVTAWVLSEALNERGDKTRVLAAAGAKRRAYRSFLAWTGDNKLCGAVGERVVGDVLESLRGSRLWIPPTGILGRVRELQGRPITIGGPLDAAGEWAKNPARIADGTIPFAVEVKNVRSILYPYDHDVWDLLAKLAAFPDVLPVLVARKFHTTTFRMFKDIGVLGTEMRAQFFSPTIPADQFRGIVGTLGFHDARQYVGGLEPGLATFFSRTGPQYGQERLDLWSRAASVVANYPELRDEGLDEGGRAELFNQFASDLKAVGLYQGGWAAVFEEDETPPWNDTDDLDF